MEGRDGVDAYVPGVTVPGNRRPRKPTKVNTGRKTQEVKAKIPAQQPVVVENLTPRKMDTIDDLTKSLEESPAPQSRKHSRKASSLKDLCAEDKKRVANLIKELAKMGDEKEKAMDQLQSERRQFEKQVIQLVEQQEQILSEREDIQSRLFQCQNLLGRYKDQILSKEEKLSSDVSKMSQNKTKKVICVDIQKRLFECQNLLVTYQAHLCERQERISTDMSKMRRPHSPLTGGSERRRRGSRSPEDQIPRDHLDVKRSSPRSKRSASPDAVHRDERLTRSPRSDLIDEGRDKENRVQKNEVLHKKYADVETAKSSIRRPYTSLIDKEIANEKQYPDGPSTIASETLTPRSHKSVGYYNRVPTLGVFRDPIMSSTQKSADINAYITPQSPTGEFHPLEPDHSPRSSRASLQELFPPDRQKLEHNTKLNSRVGFKEKLEINDEEMEKHSPSVHSTVGDRKFMEQYKKLQPTERKRELLKQREALLEEQEKLKQILMDQEAKLMKKQEQLQRKQNIHKSRLDYLEQNGQLPARTENDSVQGDDGSIFNGKIDKLNLDKHLSDDDVKPHSDEDDDIPYEAADLERRVRAAHLKDYSTKGTSPIHQAHPPYHSMATSPIRMERSEEHSPARVDIGTSMSRVLSSRQQEELDHIQHHPSTEMQPGVALPYTNPRSPKSPRLADRCEEIRQSNLPLQANRQKSVNSPVQRSQHTPGEKTLSVLEIVNSLDENPSWNGSNQMNSPARSGNSQPRTPSSSARVVGTAQIRSPGGAMLGGNPLSPTVKDRFDENEAEETAEESEILDDIFFLK